MKSMKGGNVKKPSGGKKTFGKVTLKGGDAKSACKGK